MKNRRWAIPLTLFAGAALCGAVKSGLIRRLTTDADLLTEPAVGIYDVAAGSLFDGFYTQVAKEIAAVFTEGKVLDAGCGPGYLTVRLAQMAPRLDVVGLDISQAMINRARRRVSELGLEGRVSFQFGDVQSMPFPDGQFDFVVSTLSLHHWADPVKGLGEIYRVLKLGSQARIIDLPDWVRLNIHGQGNGRRLVQLATASPFNGGVVSVYRWPWRFPTLRCLWLRR